MNTSILRKFDSFCTGRRNVRCLQSVFKKIYYDLSAGKYHDFPFKIYCSYFTDSYQRIERADLAYRYKFGIKLR